MRRPAADWHYVGDEDDNAGEADSDAQDSDWEFRRVLPAAQYREFSTRTAGQPGWPRAGFSATPRRFVSVGRRRAI
eukprot:11214727-Lingulodinium_polyedra.AAC.1